MASSFGQELGDKLMEFVVESIKIGSKSIDSNGVVQINKSHIQFYVSSEQSPTPIRIKIEGAHIHTLCFNFWSGRGNIALFIDAAAAKTAFSVLADAHILTDWNFSHGGISFGVTAIHRDVREAIAALNKNVQLSFDCTTTASAHGLRLSNKNSGNMQTSSPNGIIEIDSEGPTMSMPIVIDVDQEEMSMTSTEVNNNDEKYSVVPMDITTTSENRVVIEGESSFEGRQQIAICMEDLDCLRPREYLNDNVINAYLKLILADKQAKKNVPNIQLLDNFLLRTLSRDIDMKQSYSAVANKYGLNKELCQEIADKKKRLIKKYKIFEADYLVLPICHDSHWFMIIVCHLSKIRHWGHKILIFDSMYNSEYYYEEHLNVLLHFIVGSYIVTEKAGEQDVRKFMEDLFRNFTVTDVPRQSNTTDCGLYLFEYFERFFDNPAMKRKWPNLIDKKVMRFKRRKVLNALKEFIEQSRS